MAKRKVYSHSRGKFVAPKYELWGNWPGERWERVPNTGEYRIYVSNYGNVYKEVRRNTKHYGWTPITVRPYQVPWGWMVKVGRYRKTLHRMVADVFQLCGPKIMVSFKDGNRWNARLSNLAPWGQRKDQKLTELQRQLAKKLFKRYPQQKIVSELADRFMVNYRTMWMLYQEFRRENINNGNFDYEQFASNPDKGLLPRFPDMHVRQQSDLLRSIWRSMGSD